MQEAFMNMSTSKHTVQDSVFMNMSTSKAVEYAIVESPMRQSVQPGNPETEDYFEEDPGDKLNISTDVENDLIGGKSSIFGASFNFINSIVGCGIIGIPLAIGQCGFFFGIFLLILVAYLVLNSVLMLINAGIKEKKLHLEELAEHLLGVQGYYVASISMFLYAYGAMIAYMVIIGDNVPPVILHVFHHHIDREIVMMITATAVILPLSLYKDMSSLSATSAISITADTIMVILVVCISPTEAEEQGIVLQAKDYNFISHSLFIGLSTMSFAFVCQHNCFIVFRSLRLPNSQNWGRVAKGSIGVSLFLCMLFGVAGYLSFGPYLVSDILNNFKPKDDAVSVARGLLAFTMLFTFPMELFVTRHTLQNMWIRNYEQQPAKEEDTEEIEINLPGNEEKKPFFQSLGESVMATVRKIDPMGLPTHVTLTMLLWGSSCGIALVAKDLGVVLSLTGAVAASVLGYILPALIFFKSNESELAIALLGVRSSFLSGEDATERAGFIGLMSPVIMLCKKIYLLRKFTLAGFMFVVGVMVMVIGVMSIFLSF